MSDSLNLTQNFPEKTQDDWMAFVSSLLKGKDFDTLIALSEDGISKGPLWTAEDLPEKFGRLGRMDVPQLGGRPWHITSPVRDPDLAHANTQALEDLKGGASALRIETGEGALRLKDKSHIKRLLEQIYTDLIPISFAPNGHNAAIADVIMGLTDLRKAHINFGLNPLTDADMIARLAEDTPSGWRAITLNAAGVHEQGGTEVLELANLAAHICHAMQTFTPELAHRHMMIELAVTQDGHLMIAKLRAARRIYARIAESFGLADTTVAIHAITSQRMMQTVDPWTNMLRVMSAGFGAVCGGANFITTRPFTDGLGLPTAFGHRIARNMQLMMMEESHLGQVQDVAFGSYFHEHLTDQLAQAAWSVFQDIERAGGIQPHHAKGTFQADLDKAIQARRERADPIVGVTLHPATDATTRKAQIRQVTS